jgi:Domain of unknown function (DUF6265)
MNRLAVGVSVLVVTLVLAGSPRSGAGQADIASLSWLAGSWEGKDASGLEMEEVWMAPRGGTMLGLHRDVKDGRLASFEFLRIEAGAEGLVYQAQPRGRPATPFPLKEASGRKVVFENAKHDFPQRILYWVTDDEVLHARVEGVQGGKLVGEEWSWRRAGTGRPR